MHSRLEGEQEVADAIVRAQDDGGAPGFHAALTPFISLTLAKAARVPIADQLKCCLADIEAICAAEKQLATSDFTRLPELQHAGLRLQAMWYRRTLKPAWTGAAEFVDV